MTSYYALIDMIIKCCMHFCENLRCVSISWYVPQKAIYFVSKWDSSNFSMTTFLVFFLIFLEKPTSQIQNHPKVLRIIVLILFVVKEYF
jgi:hypothetical protein